MSTSTEMHATAAAAGRACWWSTTTPTCCACSRCACRPPATASPPRTASSAARNRLGVERFDLVVSDVPPARRRRTRPVRGHPPPASGAAGHPAHLLAPLMRSGTALGVAGYLTKPFDSQACWGIRQTLQRAGPPRPQRSPRRRPASAGDTAWRAAILSRSSRMRAVLDGPVWSPPRTGGVLIRGDSGTGRELLARAIHLASPRAASALRRDQLRRHSRTAAQNPGSSAACAAPSPAPPAPIGAWCGPPAAALFLDEIDDIPPRCRSSCCAC